MNLQEHFQLSYTSILPFLVCRLVYFKLDVNMEEMC